MTKPVLFGVVVILIDQMTKFWAVQSGIATVNTGISLGILQTQSQLPLVIITIALLGLLARWWGKNWVAHPYMTALFFGSALSNTLDRILFGGVHDWLPVPLLQISNNLADWGIFIALLVLAISMQKVQHKNV